MRRAAAYYRAWILAGALTATVSYGQTNLPTLARICTVENERGWVSVSGLCHVLDFYGLGKTDLPLFPSGELALKALTDEETAKHFFGKTPFVETWHGVGYARYHEFSTNVDVGEAHRDQCLAAFAALDLPLSTPVRLKTKSYSLADLLSESMDSFGLDQRELAWSAMAFAKYIPPKTIWTNGANQEIDFSKLANALLAVDLNSQRCAGTHVFEAVVLIEKADRKNRILDEPTRVRLNAYLRTTIEQIVQSQNSDGSWSRHWCPSLKDDEVPMSPFQTSFLVTGHLLEILNKVDPSLRPEREVFVKAANWVANSMNSPEIRPNGFWVCPFTHAAHGAHQVLD